MATDKMRVVMVGVDGFGAYRRERMRETRLFKIVAAYDINPAALTHCENEDGAKPVASYEELLETADIEAMIVSTGAKFHAEHALAAMEQGLHVFVEKPLCSTLDEMYALLEIQKKTRLVVGVGHNDHKHDEYSLQLKLIIDSGELGKIVTFEETTAHSGGLQIKPGEWRGDPEKNPGGMLFQCGVHAIHSLLFYFGPIRRVSAMMRYDVHTTGTADVAHCLLEFESGLTGTLSAYHVTPYRHTFNVYGSKTNIYSNARYFNEGTQTFMQTTKLDGRKEPMVPLKFKDKGRSDICGNLKSFYKAVSEGGEPYPSLKDGARAVAVIFAAEKSAKTGKTVEVPVIE